tara:strand:+ start:1172 stop:1399 length:228 start_codon:yes stop_codon:yes gene_type:complete
MKLKTLDLHGHYHDAVDRIVSNFVFLNDLPVKIIIGNSRRMQELVKQTLDYHGFEYHNERWINHGCLIVDKKTDL